MTSPTRAARSVLLALLTPLLEKNPVKTVSTRTLDTPFVLSMTRLVVLAFAVAMLHQIWLAGIAGWPDATLSIGIVLAMPILAAMERADPAVTLEFAKTLLGRFGEGAVRTIASVYPTAPSKYDDHRDDGGGAS